MKYKALKTGYPKVTFPENTEFVNREIFLTDEPDRIPLLIETQFGIIPSEFSDYKKLPLRKVAIISKSLLSGVQLEPKIYHLN